VVEGWRFIPHSYAVVNQWQLLALSRRDDINLRVRDIPYFNPAWKRVSGLFDAGQEAALSTLPVADEGAFRHATLRITFPYNFLPAARGRTAVFATAEYGVVPPSYLTGSRDIAKLAQKQGHDFLLISPSRWSIEGFVRLGLRSDQVALIPHGVDTNIYRPEAESRATAREKLGLSGFVFLHVSTMTGNKGIDALLRAFARVAQKDSGAVLLLKGADGLYNSKGLVQAHFARLAVHDQHLIASRLIYLGNTFSMERMATLYRAADAYVTPYRAEGFNIPALEAAASGLPVICTSGGSTDDFVRDSFARKIRSRPLLTRLENVDGHLLEPDVDHLADLMLEVIENAAWREAAAIAGPQHVASRYTWDIVTRLLTDALFGDARRSLTENEAILQAQAQRRPSSLKWNFQVPAQMQQSPSKQPRRNEQCPCGSGKKYKWCCGSYK
jgi:glycosyltransferase involved in cell wall biosynthesis